MFRREEGRERGDVKVEKGKEIAHEKEKEVGDEKKEEIEKK